MTSEDFTRVFLLVGKTGTGKSATGNSILGNPSFKCADASMSVTSEISWSTVVRQGYTLTVIDAPGVMDTNVNSTEAKWKSCREMIHAMSSCPTSGKLAILLVLKYGDRFTQENRSTIQILKSIFGEENLWKSCIIMFTHGDLFDAEYEGLKHFEDWLREQRGDLGKIIENCGFKCVLFYNKSKSPVKQEEQLKELMGLVDQLDQGYTKDKFEEAKKQQNRLQLEGLLPKLVEEFQIEIDLLIAAMHHLTITSKSGKDVMRLEALARELLTRINKMDDPEKIFYDREETRILEDIRNKVTRITSQINLLKDTVEIMKMRDLLKSHIDNLIDDIDKVNPRVERMSSQLIEMENRAKALWSKVAAAKLSPSVLSTLEPMISLAKQKLEKLHVDVEHIENARTLTLEIDGLQDQLSNQIIPTLVSTFATFTERADQILSKINTEGLQHQDKVNLLERITDLKTHIYNFKIDNDMKIGWTSTSIITGVISAFTAFIPIVGIPITIGLNVAPVVGQAIHRTVERSRRQAEAEKRNKK